ncbi:MAG TPA: efflux RND transporter periplasmic adaptor subunit, partial [Steroidobacteraceae bacterium]|nr:efflux RND transporter periplasmic adaptor subunit [Steroidobacteraceae bacterium]
TARRLALAAAVLVVVLLAWWLIVHLTARKPLAKAPPPIPVDAATATARDMPALEPALGTVLSMDVVNVMPQVNGRITRIYFKQGDEVRKGQKLFEIDPRPYQAALEQAQGQLARDQATLAEARMDLARYRKLVAENSIQRQTEEDQVDVVGQDMGTVKLDQGNVAAAAVNLSFTEVTAPIAGRTGALQVDLGNYVQAASAAQQAAANSAGSSSGTATASGGTGGASGGGGGAAPLVTITRLQPIYVSFDVPENQLETIRENQAKGALSVAAYTATGKLLATGKLTLINNQVDSATGTIMLEATFANRTERLWPNEFVSVQLTEFVRRNAVTVPATAVMTGPNGQYVYVIGAGNKVKQVNVEVTATQQGVAVIGKGLAAGAKVVTEGQYRLDNGVVVSTQARAPSTPGAATAAPQPAPASTPSTARSPGSRRH